MSRMPRLPLLPLLLSVSGLASGCLDALVDDELDPNSIFGDGMLSLDDPEALAAVSHVDTAPDYAERVQHFATEIAYLRGYANGRRVWYWNVPGPNVDFIVPMYKLVEQDGTEVGFWVFDALPGDGGYSPWWRKFTVKKTASFDETRGIWSRESIDLGVRMGMLEPPEATEYVYNFPIVDRHTKVARSPDAGDFVGTSTAWYRNQRVSFIKFTEKVMVPVGQTEFPKYPVYVLQRINEAAPLYEYATGVDVDGDGRLINSNNIFAGDLDDERYSPLWYLAEVRVPAGTVSVDTSTAVTFSRESELYEDAGRTLEAEGVDVKKNLEVLVNCPIQRERGAL